MGRILDVDGGLNAGHECFPGRHGPVFMRQPP